jgi:hypothetical protein
MSEEDCKKAVELLESLGKLALNTEQHYKLLLIMKLLRGNLNKGK